MDPSPEDICACFGQEIAAWDAYKHFRCSYTEGTGNNLMEYYTECQKYGNLSLQCFSMSTLYMIQVCCRKIDTFKNQDSVEIRMQKGCF